MRDREKQRCAQSRKQETTGPIVRPDCCANRDSRAFRRSTKGS